MYRLSIENVVLYFICIIPTFNELWSHIYDTKHIYVTGDAIIWKGWWIKCHESEPFNIIIIQGVLPTIYIYKIQSFKQNRRISVWSSICIVYSLDYGFLYIRMALAKTFTLWCMCVCALRIFVSTWWVPFWSAILDKSS